MDIQRRLTRFEEVASAVRYGLRGHAFRWSQGERKLNVPVAALMGCTLLTATALQKAGHRLRRGTRPVGSAYFGAPLSLWADLYVVEMQTSKPQNKNAVPQGEEKTTL